MILDLLNEEEESKDGKPVQEHLNPCIEERILVVNNLPCLFIMFMSETYYDQNSEEIFVNHILPIFDKLTLDPSIDVRIACA
jgi:hypothetical protein